MAEANRSLAEAEVLAKLGFGIRIAAQRKAIEAVKRQWRGQGRKVVDLCHREIVLMAEEYLAQHPELIAEAKPVVWKWFAQGMFGKRAARAAQSVRNPPQIRTLPASEAHDHRGIQR